VRPLALELLAPAPAPCQRRTWARQSWARPAGGQQVLRLASESSNAAASCLLLLRHHKMVAVCPPRTRAVLLALSRTLALAAHGSREGSPGGREGSPGGGEGSKEAAQEEGREARRQQWAKAEEGREGGDGDALTR